MSELYSDLLHLSWVSTRLFGESVLVPVCMCVHMSLYRCMCVLVGMLGGLTNSHKPGIKATESLPLILLSISSRRDGETMNEYTVIFSRGTDISLSLCYLQQQSNFHQLRCHYVCKICNMYGVLIVIFHKQSA